jgi:hypothetical protein
MLPSGSKMDEKMLKVLSGGVRETLGENYSGKRS